MKLGAFVAVMLGFAGPAQAGLFGWSAESEDDPFSGGKKVTVSFMSSVRSGVIIFCDSSETGLEVRAIPGFDYVDDLKGFIANASVAIDGKLLFDATGIPLQVGNNLAAVGIPLDRIKAKKFTEAFMTAKKQVAIKDGIADKPHLLTAKGSTSAGKALMSCMNAQAGQEP